MTNPLSNQFVESGITLMVVGAGMALLRQLPVDIYHWLKRKVTVSVTIFENEPIFEWAKIWLDSLPYAHETHSSIVSLLQDDSDGGEDMMEPIFTPNYGNHFFKHNGRFIWMERNKGETGDKNAVGRGGKGHTPDSIVLTMLAMKQTALRALISEIKNHAHISQRKRIKAYISSFWWRRLIAFKPRAIATVDLPQFQLKELLGDIARFLQGRSEYGRRGIPYHRNYLLEGIPGAGKTSLVSALAGHFEMNLYIMNIAGPGMNDERLVDLMMGVPPQSIVLLEDIDAVVPERKKAKKIAAQQNGASPTAVTGEEEEGGGVTLSGLLNCLDGLTAPEAALIFMTSNHPETLDPAMVRPGRVDYRMQFTQATEEQIRKMFTRLRPFGKVDNWLVYAGDKSMAEVQKLMMVSSTEDHGTERWEASPALDRELIGINNGSLV